MAPGPSSTLKRAFSSYYWPSHSRWYWRSIFISINLSIIFFCCWYIFSSVATFSIAGHELVAQRIMSHITSVDTSLQLPPESLYVYHCPLCLYEAAGLLLPAPIFLPPTWDFRVTGRVPHLPACTHRIFSILSISFKIISACNFYSQHGLLLSRLGISASVGVKFLDYHSF